jgi:hypothetical protein
MRNRQDNSLNVVDDDNDEAQSFIYRPRTPGAMPCPAELLSMKPKPHSGYAMKKNNSIMAWVCPCFVTQWKKRFVILAGSYLLRYEDEYSEKTKGVPIPLESCTASFGEDLTVEVSTLRKSYIFKFTSHKECQEWVNAIRTRKAEGIREEMGHAEVSETVKTVNRLAKQSFMQRLKLDGEMYQQEQGTENPIAMAMMGR